MAPSASASRVVRFGAFEVDLEAAELRKQGAKVKLQDQPFKVLKLLLEQPGQIVTHDELRTRVWPANTFVEFDQGLYSAMARLRDALRDSSESPRFIETVPRHGYRFIAPVEQGSNLGNGQPQAGLPKNLVRKFIVGCLAGSAAVAVLAAAFFGGRVWRSSRRPVLIEKDTIVLGDFANSTSDSVFDGTLREGLSVQLEQSPFLSLVSEEGIHQTLRMMGKPTNAQLTPEITREICQRTSSTTSLTGSIALIGSKYELILKAVNCVNGDLLAGTQAVANDKSHVLDALSKAVSDMRRKLGESQNTLQKYNIPLEQATTPSLEALQAYSLGFRKSWMDGDLTAALLFFQRAIQLDPNFAMAYSSAGDTYFAMGESTRAAENIRRAFELRARTSELERLLIEDDNLFLTGDLMKVRHIDELGIQTYGREAFFHFDLAAISTALGQYETALKEYRESFRRAPYNSFFQRGIICTYLFSNRVEEAAAAAREAEMKSVDTRLAHVLYWIAFYRGDSAEMARQTANASGKPGEEDLLLALEADTAAYSGHLQKAREFSLRAQESAEQEGEKETAATYRAVSALREALFGNAAVAQQRTTEVEGSSHGRDWCYAVALAFVHAGDAMHAQPLAGDLGKQFPEDTIVQFNYLPALRAKLALLRANPLEALHSLQAAAPYELGLPVTAGSYNWPNLYPVYVRGEAYLAAQQGREAAAEFQKILDHRGIVLNEPIGALAHLQLGRAYALQGDSVKARTKYQDFLTLWKDADPDIPILKRAKAEYAKLQ